MKVGKAIGWVILGLLILVLLWFPQTLRLVWYKLLGSEEQKAQVKKAQDALTAALK